MRFFPLILVILILGGCSGNSKTPEDKITVSILPLKYLVESIAGNDFTIDVIVPPGSSPESYEPTPRQVVDMNNSLLIFTTGLIDFETEIIDRVSQSSDISIVELYHGLDLLNGECSHSNHAGHNHGLVDPHIWTSIPCLKIMASHVYSSLNSLYPDSVKYHKNFQLLIEKLDTTNSIIKSALTENNIKSFIIYHPALTYYSSDYGIVQISIEENGKEPSVEKMSDLIRTAKEQDLSAILYQREFSRSVVETLAHDIGAEIVEIDPLAENIPENLINITRIICGAIDKN